MDNPEKLNHLSLCAGYGGIDLGLSRALGNTRTVCFVEIEAFNIENLVSKIEAGLLDPAPIFSNLKSFPWELFNQKVDIVSGGFPCQPFSAAGRRGGDEDPRHLFPYIIDGLQRMGRPPLVFFENVEGIISSRLKGDQWSDPEGTPVLLHVLRELERLGYKSTAGVFSAAEVGATHQRRRVFILGIRDDLKQSGLDLIRSNIEHSTSRRRTAYPRGRGADQHPFEPPRVTMGHPDGERLERDQVNKRASTDKIDRSQARQAHDPPSSPRNEVHRQTKPAMGGESYGPSDRVDYAELYESFDNRVDELRSLGNGVVPDTAARAFRVLFDELSKVGV